MEEEENSEEKKLYHDGIVYHANIDENLRRLNMENLMYPGPVVPFIGYQSNDDDMYSKIPNSKGDDIPEIELSTLEAKNMAVKISISEKGQKNRKGEAGVEKNSKDLNQFNGKMGKINKKIILKNILNEN